MIVSQAIVTSQGGMASHAAVVARGMVKRCCVAGCGELNISEENKILSCGPLVLTEGDIISRRMAIQAVFIVEKFQLP